MLNQQKKCHRNFESNQAYSLIELIITIVITSIVMLVLLNIFFTNQKNSASPIFQVKAAQLAQAYLEEVSLRKYDEVSPAGNSLRCNSPSAPSCSLILGSDAGETRSRFDDIDDYNGLSENPPIDALGNSRSGFSNFSVNISVTYAGTDFGLALQDIKLISVTVQAPDTNQYVFSQYKGNF